MELFEVSSDAGEAIVLARLEPNFCAIHAVLTMLGAVPSSMSFPQSGAFSKSLGAKLHRRGITTGPIIREGRSQHQKRRTPRVVLIRMQEDPDLKKKDLDTDLSSASLAPDRAEQDSVRVRTDASVEGLPYAAVLHEVTQTLNPDHRYRGNRTDIAAAFSVLAMLHT